jgi:hypothetical protein
MPVLPPRTPAECFSGIILWLSLTVDGHSTWGRLARPLALLILDRIGRINQRFARLAARIVAGTYVPRRSAPRSPAVRRPRRPNPLPQGMAWLLKLLPEVAAYGSQLQFLLADPAMVTLLANAPTTLHRPLRSLCRMLGVAPPPLPAPLPETLPVLAPPPSPPLGERRAASPARPHRPPPDADPYTEGPPLPAPA